MFHLTILESYRELNEVKKETQTLANRFWPYRHTQAMPPSREARKGVKYKELRRQDRGRAMAILLTFNLNGTLPRGVLSGVAEMFGVHRSTISRLWERAQKSRVENVINSPEISSNARARGRLPICSSPDVREAVKNVPLMKRRTQEQLSTVLGVSRSTVQRLVKKGTLRCHTNTLKPFLTETNMMARYLMAQSFVNPLKPGEYQDMMDMIHVDEKWFFVTKDAQRFILADDEEDPQRTCKHKSHITKVMFFCAVARPRFIPAMNQWWDGKLGIWPIGEWVPAKRSSVNREKGTLVWKNITVNREVYRDLLVEKLMPAILEKWPQADRSKRTIRIQQDGAKSHIKDGDMYFVEFLRSMKELGVRAEFFTQAPNSPDTNICDLGFFRAIQSCNLIVGSSEAQLLESVQNAFDSYPRDRLNHTWLTLQSCFNEIIKAGGGNDYKIPHMNKQGLERRGELPHVLPVADNLCSPTSSNLQD